MPPEYRDKAQEALDAAATMSQGMDHDRQHQLVSAIVYALMDLTRAVRQKN